MRKSESVQPKPNQTISSANAREQTLAAPVSVKHYASLFCLEIDENGGASEAGVTKMLV